MSFFDKLKRGMKTEDLPENVEEEIKEESKEPQDESREEPAEKPKKQKIKKWAEPEIEEKPVENKIEKPVEKEEIKIEKEKSSESLPVSTKIQNDKEDKWAAFSKEAEGQLAIDVYQTEENLVIQSAIAGVKPDSLDISIEGDMILIKGIREKPAEETERNYFYQECFWGPFSRQIILSVEVDPSRTEATLKDGILTVRIPKIDRDKKRKIQVRGQEN
ncbi:MAG: Hsp20/alpha crystallin family protein [Candidatus Pacebacteria bacterium]|nr:Hsp20/alpha crystallin family protein [Candidatus Paceibacterota bacterium]